MADAKRNSMSAKVATPKIAGSPTAVDPIETLGKVLGGRVKITTTTSQTLEGTVYTICPVLNVVALNTKQTSSTTGTITGDYHIVPISRLQSVQVISLPPNNTNIRNLQPSVGAVDAKRLQERVRNRVRQLKEQEETRGKGVTKEGQAIFDALKRVNIPIRWHEQQMIAYDAVIITPPYRPEDCRGAKDKQQVLGQVKKVLEGERRKLKEREERERAAAPSAGQRKGG